jgi:hypothetical protein
MPVSLVVNRNRNLEKDHGSGSGSDCGKMIRLRLFWFRLRLRNTAKIKDEMLDTLPTVLVYLYIDDFVAPN